MIDLITASIDSAKDMITSNFFNNPPSDSDLLNFNDAFIISYYGTWCKVHNTISGDTVQITVTYQFNKRGR